MRQQSSEAPSTDDAAPSDEEMRKLLKPNPTDEQVLEALRVSYVSKDANKTVRIVKELESYDDKNYLVEIGGEQYLAKVHNGVESEDYIKADTERRRRLEDGGGHNPAPTSVIDLQNFIFAHLSDPKHMVTTSAPISLVNHKHPDPTVTAGGDNEGMDDAGDADFPPVSIHKLPVVSSSHSPHQLVVRLLTWVKGRTMSSVRALPIETLAEAGAYLGRVCTALDELGSSEPNAREAATRYHAWDGKNTGDLEKFVRCIADNKRRALVQSVIDTFKSKFGEEDGASNDFRKGILMGDFNDANILVDNGLRISGVIDFGDSTYSWRVLDISVAMAYAMISAYGKAGRSLSAAAAMLRGFNSVYAQTPLERKHLHLLVASRLACSVTLGAYSYQQNQENEYLLFHAEPAWKTLELIWGQGENGEMANAIGRIFDAACAKGCEKGNASEAVIDCSDIALPDPTITDLLNSVRKEWSADHPEAPPAKKHKTEMGSEIDDDGRPAITFVTGNKKKLEEVKRILSASPDVDSRKDDSSSSNLHHLPFAITNQKIDLPELQGEPDDIAKEKCALAAKAIGGPVIIEDTSLCFAALKDLPGPYIKWFLDKCGLDGLNDMIKFTDDKSAYAQTVVAFSPGPRKDVVIFDGRTQGKIVPPRGKLDFGWDPVFEPDEGDGLTYAEMTKEGKDAISHRSRAFARLRDYFLKEEENIKANI